jgi:precorrin-6A synthase
LRDDIAAGQTNVCVMLTGTLDLTGLDDWSIWWGANLGADGEAVVAGRVGEVRAAIDAARARAKDTAGWVMDVCVLRGPEERS